ncbi:polyphosphate kinase 2 family protein [Ureibacillus sp. GCM10028918]|uniref:polyphosphate kinase 2 family protein n=1 Tax=Ureibacillus sp. GCM10028918 TaxID=3273429 RepID=UPI00361B29C2
MQKIEDLDLDITMDKKEFKIELEILQYEMLKIQQLLFKNKIGLIIAFEGMDAAGKGGAIKRLTQSLDPRGFFVHPISAPQTHERSYHYLHRFWEKLPQHGQIAIFDRSWYGRVLVERVEGFANQNEWERAYNEINTFEKMLTDDRYIVIKFWIHVGKDEQLSRFKERQTNPMKSWKLTEEDWRNREKFDEYVKCANEMFQQTDSINAPWKLVSGNNKHYARIKVLRETFQHVKQVAVHRGLANNNF